jgi:heme/copper-type cytochrome/quinol oxidase subunit 3
MRLYTRTYGKIGGAAAKNKKVLLLISYALLNFHGCHVVSASLIQMLISTKAVETSDISSYTAHKGINDKMFVYAYS